MGVIDLSKFTFKGDLIKSIGELTFELMRNERNALTFVSTFGNIKVEREVGFIGKGGLVGMASTGCNPTPQDFSVSTRVVKWDPTDWEVLLHLCYKDLDGTIAEYERKSGVRKPDFTDSDYEAIVEMVLARALNEFLWRFLWFNDKNAKNVTSGGVITNGTNVSYFNLIDGYWKQIFTQVTTNPSQRVEIAANAKTTYAEQTMTPTEARNILSKMIYSAPIELRQQQDRFILATQNLVDLYVQSLSDSAQLKLETVESKFINGVDVIKIAGVEVIPMPEWDENIYAYENTGTALHKPFRALYTCKSVLAAGFDNEADFSNLETWYDRDSRKVKIEAMGNGDAKLLHPALFIAAY